MVNKLEVIAEVKDFLALNRTGMLSTISKSEPGYPFGSIVPYDMDEGGNFIIFIANISEHQRNLLADSRACLLVADPFGINDPQAHSRASILGEFKLVDSEQNIDAVKHSYWERFPAAVDHSITHTFSYFRCVPKRIRWIGGFGAISWIDGQKYAAAPRDPIAYHGAGILDHMNRDHADALVDMIRHHAGKAVKETEARMAFVNTSHFAINYLAADRSERLVLEFPRLAETAEDVRKMLIEMLKICRAGD